MDVRVETWPLETQVFTSLSHIINFSALLEEDTNGAQRTNNGKSNNVDDGTSIGGRPYRTKKKDNLSRKYLYELWVA